MLERQRRYREAVAAYTRAARLDTAGARWRARLGGVLERQGRFGDAEAALLEALRRETDRLDAHLSLAMIYRRQGKYDLKEGVVIKGGSGADDLWMCKVKTLGYLERLEQAFGTRWQDYWE